MGGVRQNQLEDLAAITIMRLALGAIAQLPNTQQLSIIELLSPSTAKIIAPILLDLTPDNPNTVAPKAAWKKAKLPTPREQYAKDIADRPETPADHAPKDPGAGRLLQFR
ncbi:hypothetical protein OLMES_5083 [Oleiphilus messinensis]|uniref:Uncharacterized protein n=1 Tax=Oleiphilus messinensis TaxID=141451 RepID=A0A1Y0IEV3_9GAMM|nr:hypothetical protein [Oleiphilus messinensis]ARU59067.1 hypothetical protein OLMES_5083 [Oleiphilus messinensis]